METLPLVLTLDQKGKWAQINVHIALDFLFVI